jgi:hypothetical protein
MQALAAGFGLSFNIEDTDIYNVGSGTDGTPEDHKYMGFDGLAIVGIVAYGGAAAVLDSTGNDFILVGDFATDTQWIKGDPAITIAAGVATWSGAQAAAADLSQPAGIVIGAGRTYIVTYTTTRTAGTLTLVAGGTLGTARSTADTFVETIVGGTVDTTLLFRGDSDFAGTLDDVSIAEQNCIELIDNDSDGNAIPGHALPNAFSCTEAVMYDRIGPHKRIKLASGKARVYVG